MNLEKLFNPKSIAIVGATDEKGKVGTAICQNLLNLGYPGNVFLVNPKHSELFGKKCYSRLEDIEIGVDLAIIAIPAKFVSDVLKNGSNKVKDFVIISAGFSEIGPDGLAREEEILEIAEKNELTILGPNCLGFIIPGLNLNASFASDLPKKGNVAFISQSGALISSILDISREENFGFSGVISIGNKMDLDESAIIRYFSNDSETKLIALYLEGIKSGERFRKIAKEVSKIKPVIILKAGKTEKSQRAIASHTGALAGSEMIVKEIFKKTGIIQAETTEDLVNLIKLISLNNPPENKKTIILTNAGGPGVLATDAFQGKNLELSEINEETKKELRMFLPPESSVENPIDLLGDAQQDRYEKTLKTIEKENAGSVICLLTPQDNTPIKKIAQKISDFKEKNNIVSCFFGGEKITSGKSILEKCGIPNFQFPEKAVEALDAYYFWREKQSADENEFKPNEEESQKRRKSVLNIVEEMRSKNRSATLFSEAKDVMNAYDIPISPHQDIKFKESLSNIKISYPMTLKVDSENVLHKTDRNGIVLNIQNKEELEKNYDIMSQSFPKSNMIIQPMQKIKTEMILGIKKDPIAGSVILCGMGGIYAEALKMVEIFIPPVNIQEIKEKIMGSSFSFLFKEYRGQNPYNLDEFSDIIFKLSLLAEEIEEIKELDINPLLIYNDRTPAMAIDVKIII